MIFEGAVLFQWPDCNAQWSDRTNRARAEGKGPIGSEGPLGIAEGTLKQHSARKQSCYYHYYHHSYRQLPPALTIPLS